MRRRTLLVVAGIAAFSGMYRPIGRIAMARQEDVEQPPFEVVGTIGPIEIRQYGPRLAAEADMSAGSGINEGQYSAFMALANFIFAKDRKGPEVAMTAPVSIEQANEPIAMTAPVAMEPEGEGMVMRFFMPAEYTLETLPRPGDDRVRIITVPAQSLAVLRFSGEATDAEVERQTADLLQGVQGSTWSVTGQPGYFGYDPPMTPPAEQRHEVFVEVASNDGLSGTPGPNAG